MNGLIPLLVVAGLFWLLWVLSSGDSGTAAPSRRAAADQERAAAQRAAALETRRKMADTIFADSQAGHLNVADRDDLLARLYAPRQGGAGGGAPHERPSGPGR
ncbi:MAG: hypothetical protein ACP5VP_10995 [Candidatus Limnocylindrales bacterium]